MLLDVIGAVLLGFASATVIGTIALGLGSNLGERLRTAGVLIVWFAIVLLLAATGVLHAPTGASPDIARSALARFGISVGFPLTAIVVGVLTVPSLRQRVIDMPMAMLVGVNSIRMLGALFLVMYSAGRLPAPFAPTAGWGDILVGALAIPLGLATRHRENRPLLLAWSAFGLADLVTAVSLGVATSLGAFQGVVSTGAMTLLPWLLIPGFLVPLFAAMHLAVFYKLLRPGAAPSQTVFA